jgi:ribosomal protein S12 methylthiotransferase accessory factor
LAEGGYVSVDAIAADLLPHLNGQHTVAQVASLVGKTHSLPTVLRAVQKLDRMGLLGDAAPGVARSEAAHWDIAGVEPSVAVERLRSGRVALVVLGDVDPAPVEAALAADHLAVERTDVRSVASSVADADGRPTLFVVVCDDYQHPALADLNEVFLAADAPWILATLSGWSPWIGPLFVPGETGCWSCMDERVNANRMVQAYLRRFGGLSELPAVALAQLASGAQVAGGILASEVAHFVATGASRALAGRLLSLDQMTLDTQFHQLVRRPQCAACGDPTIMQIDPKVELAGAPIVFGADGGLRSCRPEDTVRRLEHQISPILGAVSWLEPLHTPEDSDLCHTYSAGHNFAMLRNNLDALRRNLRGNSGGKGSTDAQARASAVCEAIERLSGVWSEDRPVTRSVRTDLDHRSIHPNDLMLFHEQQFDERDLTNPDPRNQLHQVPLRWQEDSMISWSTAWSLTHDEPVYVPSAYCWFGHPDSVAQFFTYADGNGNASGNNLDEAILQGFCELAERDAVGIWWYNRIARPGVDLAVFQDPYMEALSDFYAKLGREIWMLDLTNDLGIPTFAAISQRTSGSPDVIVAFGAHPVPRLAAMRALTEVNQFLPAVSDRNEDGTTNYGLDDVAAVEWFTNASTEVLPWLLPAPEMEAVDPTRYDVPPMASVADYVTLCVERCRNVGLELLVLDQSRPDIELSVAKVMAPGIRHFWRRTAPGRLYDVPVQLGWQDAPTEWDDLNPMAMFF